MNVQRVHHNHTEYVVGAQGSTGTPTVMQKVTNIKELMFLVTIQTKVKHFG